MKLGKLILSLATLTLLMGGSCADDQTHPENQAQPSKNTSKRSNSEPLPTITPHPLPDPSAMASAENNPKFVVLKLVADTDFGGKIEYTVHSGAPQTITIKREQLFRDTNGTHYVLWHLPVIAEDGTTYGFSWFPNGFSGRAFCFLYAKGRVEDYQIVQGGSCAVSYSIPKVR